MKFFNKSKEKKKEKPKSKSPEAKVVEMEKETGDVELDLSLRPTEEIKTSKIVKDVYKEEIDGFHGLEEGLINIDTSYVVRVDEGYEALVYIRNATEYDMEIHNPCLIVANDKQQILLQQVFDGKELGKIPEHSARPWKILFDKTYLPESVDLKGLSVAFNYHKPFAKDDQVCVGFNSLEGLSDEDALSVISYNYKLPLLKEGEVNFSMYYYEIVDGYLHFGMIIRNSTKETFIDPETLKPIVNELPIAVYIGEEKVWTETLRMGAVVGPKQARYVHMATNYKLDKIENLLVKLNEK